MSKIVLIILAAVVALIIIVVLTGMRYLRADDEGLDADDSGSIEDTGSFEDTGGFGLSLDDSDQRRRAAGARQRPGRPAVAGRSQGTSRSGVEAGRPTRDETGRRAEDGGGRRPGQGAGRPARDEAGHEGRDEARRRGRDEADWTERGHGSRSGRDQGESGDLVTAPGRPGQGGNARVAARPSAGGAGRGGRPGSDVVEPVAEPDFTDDASSRARRGDRREDGSARTTGRQTGNSRTGRSPDRAGTDRAGAGRRDGRRSPARAGVDSGPLPEIRPRAGRGKKEAGDWPSGEWEQLSDADYWAELAADGPLTEPARPSPGRTGRGRADAARADGDRRDGRQDRIDAAAREIRPRERVSRPRHDEVGYGTAVGDYAGSRADHDRIEAADRTISMPASRIARMDGAPEPAPATRRPGRVQPGSDDDPLTSPSFPRITADDGRSYRRSRPDGPSRQAAVVTSYPRPGYPGAAPPPGWQDHPSWPSAGSAGPPAARISGRPGDARPEQDWSEPDRRGDGRPRPDRIAAERGGWASQPGQVRADSGQHRAEQHRVEQYRAEQYRAEQYGDGRYSGQYAASPSDGAGYREAAAHPAGGVAAVPYPSGGYGPAAPAAVAYSAGDTGGYGTGYSPGSGYSGSGYSGSGYSGSGYSGSGYPAARYYPAPSDEATAGSDEAGSPDPGFYGEPHYADVPYDQDPGYPQAAPFARDERAGYDPYAADPYGRPGYGS